MVGLDQAGRSADLPSGSSYSLRGTRAALVRGEPASTLICLSVLSVVRQQAGSRPGGRGTLSLLRQIKVPKRKATRWSGSPALRFGAASGSRQKQGLAKLACGSNNASPDPLLPSSAQPDGWRRRPITYTNHSAYMPAHIRFHDAAERLVLSLSQSSPWTQISRNDC